MSAIPSTLVVLYGPKSPGKAKVVRALREAGAGHLDADRLALDLLQAGVRPDPVSGWSGEITWAVGEALKKAATIALESGTSYESDREIVIRLDRLGVRVVRVKVTPEKRVVVERFRTHAAEATTEGSGESAPGSDGSRARFALESAWTAQDILALA